MIETLGLVKAYSGAPVLNGLSLTVDARGVTVVLGPSGCGKTTLLRLIAGLEEPERGEIRVDGQWVTGPDRPIPPARRGLGMVFQDLALWPHLRVREQVAFGLSGPGGRRGRAEIAGQARNMLERLGIAHLADRYPHRLSGGERQRLAIARALAPGHRYLLMDEPFANLDPLLKDDMIDLVRHLRDSLGTTVLYVTHGLDEALALADRIVLLHRGQIAGELERGGVANLSQDGLKSWYREGLGG